MNRDNQLNIKEGKSAPFPAFDPHEIVRSVQYKKIFSDEQKDFLIKCMQDDPKNRKTAKQLLEHPWIINN